MCRAAIGKEPLGLRISIEAEPLDSADARASEPRRGVAFEIELPMIGPSGREERLIGVGETGAEPIVYFIARPRFFFRFWCKLGVATMSVAIAVLIRC